MIHYADNGLVLFLSCFDSVSNCLPRSIAINKRTRETPRQLQPDYANNGGDHYIINFFLCSSRIGVRPSPMRVQPQNSRRRTSTTK